MMRGSSGNAKLEASRQIGSACPSEWLHQTHHGSSSPREAEGTRGRYALTVKPTRASFYQPLKRERGIVARVHLFWLEINRSRYSRNHSHVLTSAYFSKWRHWLQMREIAACAGRSTFSFSW